ncbi:MAG: dTDP-4-dehydrorhamnose reductase [Rikenellaceae bacterium]|nr:dTDP-4-dehydrorhamnose reductase [Rikenellaceae bacterium]
MKIWVTGAAGQLGCSLRQRVSGVADCYLFTDREVDITSRAAVDEFVTQHRPDVIINCAAYTNVEQAEEEEQVAYALNATAVGYLAAAAKRCDALLIHISTDYVFMGGCCAVLTEESHPNPINAYGRTKLAGEEALQASGCHYQIFRTAWLYSPYGKNFVKTILRLSKERDSLQVVADQIGSPTYAPDLADALVRIIENRDFYEGVFHYTNLGECSWWEFATEICRLAKRGAQVNPCTSEEFPSKALRPKSAVLDKQKFGRTFGLEIPHWKESLKRCIDELQA